MTTDLDRLLDQRFLARLRAEAICEPAHCDGSECVLGQVACALASQCCAGSGPMCECCAPEGGTVNTLTITGPYQRQGWLARLWIWLKRWV